MHLSQPLAVTWLIYTHYSQYDALASPVVCPCPSSKTFLICACAHGKVHQFSPGEDACASPLFRGFGFIMPIEAEGYFGRVGFKILFAAFHLLVFAGNH
jgi:hypothetical protein